MSTKTKVLIGTVVFVGSAALSVPDLHHPAWAHALLNFAALVLVPLLLDLIGDARDDGWTARFWRGAVRLQLPAAGLLAVSWIWPPGVPGGLLAFPWAMVLLMIAAMGFGRIVRGGSLAWPTLCRDVGLMYAAVGAAWLLAARLGWRPLNFDASIVLLTAVHFHYAGLILPVLAGLALREFQNSALRLGVGSSVIIGVPAVAAGITAAQLHLGLAFEVAAALLMAAGGCGVAALHGWLGLRSRWRVGVRCLWVTAACSLLAGMLLAALYGVRNFFQPWPWLDLAWMRALHGSVNALGFAFCGLLGWRLTRSGGGDEGGKEIEPHGREP